MPQGLDRGDRKLLIGAAVLLVILVVTSTVVTPPEEGEQSWFPSTYSQDWDGAEAAYLLLEDLGYHVERWEQSPTEITSDPANTVLVLANPTEAPSQEERGTVSEFVEAGGRILATGPSAEWLLPQVNRPAKPKEEGKDAKKDSDSDSDHESTETEAPVFEEPYQFAQTEKFKPLALSPIMRGAPEISMPAPTDWQPDLPGQVTVYGNQHTAAVITYRVGKGEVIWWAAPTPLTNGAIRDASNLQLFLNSVAPTPKVHILWDEYFHGAHGSLWFYFRRSPLVWGMAQFGLVFLAILLTYSRRQGPVRAPATVSRLSPIEFVETLGDLYYTAHADATAVQVAYHRLRFLLARQLGIAVNTPAADLARSAAAQLGWDEQPLSETLTAAERLQYTSQADREPLELVQKLFDYTARLDPRRRHDEREAAQQAQPSL
ncbi:MAG TPA: DUF4350 domain-containing protein [Candidatus Limnocylindrales bacterium]|nr:DUF4350 domain-containing protein [Candidatus Limnocylindrales bacterium]